MKKPWKVRLSLVLCAALLLSTTGLGGDLQASVGAGTASAASIEAQVDQSYGSLSQGSYGSGSYYGSSGYYSSGSYYGSSGYYSSGSYYSSGYGYHSSYPGFYSSGSGSSYGSGYGSSYGSGSGNWGYWYTNASGTYGSISYEMTDGNMVIGGTGNIPDEFFKYWRCIETIEIGAEITSIGYGAFSECSSLKKVTFEEESQLTTMRDDTFAYCHNLEEIQIPVGVEEIPQYCFYQCESLKKVGLPEGLKKIAFEAFWVAGIEEIQIPSTVTTIERYAFESTYNLKEIRIPEGVTEVGEYAFSYSGLETLYLPASLEKIGYHFLNATYSLEKIYLACNSPLTEQTEDYWYDMTYWDSYPTILTEHTGLSPVVCVDDTYHGAACSSCGNEQVMLKHRADWMIETDGTHSGTCKDCGQVLSHVSHVLTDGWCDCGYGECGDTISFTLVDGILTVSGTGALGEKAFSNNKKIREVVIGEGITGLGEHAFSYCDNLEKVSLPSGLCTLGDYVFYDCRVLSEINLPAAVTKIPNYAFMYCGKLSSFEIRETVTEIGYDAFYLSGLTEITIPSTVLSISQGAFSHCNSLEKADVQCKVIPERLFAQCSNLHTVTLAEGITAIGRNAFEYCYSLKTITIPASVETIGSSAMQYDDALETVIFAEGSALESLGDSAFYACYGLKNISLPEGIKELKKSCFFYCSSLERISIPCSVTNLERIFSTYNMWSESWTNYWQNIEVAPGSAAHKMLLEYAETAAFPMGKLFLTGSHAADGVTDNEDGTHSGTCRYCGEFTGEHIVVKTDNGDGTHSGFCKECKVSLADAFGKHTYGENGFCEGCGFDGNVVVKYFDGETELEELRSGFVVENGEEVKGTELAVPENTPKGWRFLGWFDGPSEEASSVEAIDTTVYVPEICLYAHWEQIDFSISYELYGGKNDEKNPSKYRIGDETILLASPTKKGYSFKGWYTEEGFENKLTAIESGSDGDLTLYALWQAKTYSVLFDGNGGEGTMAAMTKLAYDSTYELTANVFTSELFDFENWNTKADGSGAAYADGAEVKNLSASAGAKVTLYAQWKEKTYTIRYEIENGKNAAGNPATYKRSDETIILADASRTGYKFAGWYSDEELSEKVTAIESGSTGDITLYAKWTAKTYSILFDANGGEGTMATLTKRAYGTPYILPANTFVKDGYELAGWNLKADGSGKSFADQAEVVSLTATSGGKVTLYAQWAEKDNAIVYELNGGKNAKTNPVSYRISDETITLADASRTGYKFAGWYSDAELSEKVTAIESGSTGDITLYAKWTAKTYSILFDANGGEGTMATLTKRAYGTTYILPENTFAKEGYDFIGWNLKADGSGKSFADQAEVESLTATSGGKVTLYAQWAEMRMVFDVVYVLDGGKNAEGNPVSYNRTDDTILLADATKKGYKFAGWYSDAELQNKVTSIESGSAEDITLYAKWTAKTYSVLFDANGGEGTMEAMTKMAYGTAYTLPANTFVREDCDFEGWNLKADGSGKFFEDQADVESLTATSGGKVTLYAMWAR